MIGTVSDQQKTVFKSKAVGTLATERFATLGIDLVQLDDQVIFNEVCDPLEDSMIENGCTVFKLRSKVDVGRKRAVNHNTTLTISIFISEVDRADMFVDYQEYNGINPYAALKDGIKPTDNCRSNL